MTRSKTAWLAPLGGLVTLVAVLFLGFSTAHAQGAAPTTTSASLPPGCDRAYVVQRGDYLVRIAQKELGNPRAYWAIFTATNNAAKTDRSFARIYNPNIIRTGQKLCIPNLPGAAAAQSQAGASAIPQAQMTAPAAQPTTVPTQVQPTPAVTTPAGSQSQAATPAAQGTAPAAPMGPATTPAAPGTTPQAQGTAPAAPTGPATTPAAQGTAPAIQGAPQTQPTGAAPAGQTPAATTPVAPQAMATAPAAQGTAPAAPTGPATTPAAPAAQGTVAAAQGQAPAPATGAAGQTPTGSGKVSGTVTFRERIMPPPDAVMVVQLLDVARADAPATVIAEEKTRLGDNAPPYPFELTYDPAKLDPRGRFVVAATISYDGKVQFRSTQQYPVITDGKTSNVEIMVDKIRVARSSPQVSGAGRVDTPPDRPRFVPRRTLLSPPASSRPPAPPART